MLRAEEEYGYFVEIDEHYTYQYSNSPETIRHKCMTPYPEDEEDANEYTIDNCSMFSMDDLFVYAKIIKRTVCQLEYITGDKYSK